MSPACLLLPRGRRGLLQGRQSKRGGGSMTVRRGNPYLWAAPLAVFLIVALLPYLWVVLASFKARPDLLAQPPRWIFSPTLENYRQILVEKGFDTYLMNSLTVGIASTC